MASRWLGAALTALLLAACSGPQTPATGSPAPSTAANATSGASTAPASTKPRASGAPTPSTDAGSIAGVWWVRKVLSPGDRSALVPGAVFQDEAFTVDPGCAREPCPTLAVTITPLGHATPVTEATLKLEGDRYVSPPQAENEGPCLNADLDRVPGGATVTSTIRVWIANVRAAGTAIDRPRLLGTITLDLAPTAIGKAAGCNSQKATYDLTGSLIAYLDNSAPPDIAIANEPPNTSGGMTSLPALSVKVPGATIDYFKVEGDTLNELDGSLGNGGVHACGVINYEWHEGDQRPAACTITSFPGILQAIHQGVDASGACTIDRSTVKAKLVLEMPRWTAPKRVPRPLLAWWRDALEFIRTHEAGHVRISTGLVKTLNKRLLGAKCAAAASILRDWSKELGQAHEEYDRVEYAKPWPRPPAGY